MLALAIASFAVIAGRPVAGYSDLGPVSPDQSQEVRDLRVGERYGGGTRVRSPFVGISFVVPKDWRAFLPAGSIVFLDSAVAAGLGTIHLLTDVTRDRLLAQLSEPQSIEAGFVLHPVGAVQEDGEKLTGHYAGGDDIGVLIAMLGPSHNAVVYQFVGRKGELELFKKLAGGLASSTQFMNERDGPILKAWYEQLTGMVLTPQLEHSVAQSVGSTAIHLCSDGRYIQTIQLQHVRSRSVDGENEGVYHETGTWRIEVQANRAGLVLTKSTGVVDQHEMLHQGDQYFLDGRVALVSASNSCL